MIDKTKKTSKLVLVLQYYIIKGLILILFTQIIYFLTKKHHTKYITKRREVRERKRGLGQRLFQKVIILFTQIIYFLTKEHHTK